MSSFLELESPLLELFLSPLPVAFLVCVVGLEPDLEPENDGTADDVVCCACDEDDVCFVEIDSVVVPQPLEMSLALGARRCVLLGFTVMGVSADSNEDGAPRKNARTPI